MEVEMVSHILEPNSCRWCLVSLFWLSYLVWQKISKDKQRPICFILYIRSLGSPYIFVQNKSVIQMLDATYNVMQITLVDPFDRYSDLFTPSPIPSYWPLSRSTSPSVLPWPSLTSPHQCPLCPLQSPLADHC